MYKSPSRQRQSTLFWDLETMLDSRNPLFRLANLIDWAGLESAFSSLYCGDNGRPPKPIRLRTGLLILKHVRNVSDEQVVAQFSENAYYQYFCGMESFTIASPCVASELVHFRHRIGESGIELIFKESIRVNLLLDDRRKADEDIDKDGRGRKPDSEHDGIHRLHCPGEERNLPDGLQAAEQDYRVLS